MTTACRHLDINVEEVI